MQQDLNIQEGIDQNIYVSYMWTKYKYYNGTYHQIMTKDNRNENE